MEEPEYNPRRKKKCEIYDVFMPEEGILDENGFLFHHTAVGPLLFEHKFRLLEYGIKYQESVRFTAEEDERIKRNWRKFAKKNGFEYEDGRHYATDYARSRGRDRGVYYQEQSRMMKLNMYPSMCKWLEHRSAGQVMRRMFAIFDPHYVGLPTPFSDEEILLVYTLQSQRKSLFYISDQLKKPLARIRTMIADKKKEWARLGFGPEDIIGDPKLIEFRIIRIDQRRRFFYAVLKKLGISEGTFLMNLSSVSEEDVEKETEKMDFTKLIPSFGGFNEVNLKNSWKALYNELIKSYKNAIECDPENPGKVWKQICDEVLPCADKSVANYVIFLETLQKYVDDTATLLKIQYINEKKIARRLYKKGVISDLETFELTEFNNYHKVQTMFKSKEKSFYQKLELQLKIKEKLSIIIKCYEKLKPLEEENSLKFPVISNVLFVETAIEEIRKLDDTWYPPKFLQSSVRSPELIDLFRRSSYTAELSHALKDIITFRQMTVTDEKQLISLSKSGGVASAITRLIPRRIENAVRSQKEVNKEKPRKRGWNEDISYISCSTPLPPPQLDFTSPAPKRMHTEPEHPEESVVTPTELTLRESEEVDQTTVEISPAELSPCDIPILDKTHHIEETSLNLVPMGDLSELASNRSESESVMSDPTEFYNETKVKMDDDTGLINIPQIVPTPKSPEPEYTGWNSLF